MTTKVSTSKKDLRLMPTLRYDPVVDSTRGKVTEVFLIPYYHTRGFITRLPGESTLVGYCTESPRKVLKTLFPDYNITYYNGYHLFSTGDFEATTPMLGLGIAPVKSQEVYGLKYNGKLEELLQLGDLLKTKRSLPVSKDEVQRILAYLRKKSNEDFIDLKFKQKQHDKQEIISIISKFG